MSSGDSVDIDAAAASGGSGDVKKSRSVSSSLKILVSLFLLFVFVVSDVYTSSVVSHFDGGVRGRSPTAWGVVLQGISLVILFAIVVRLTDAGVV